MSPIGSLIAYSFPANMTQLHDVAAIVSLAWKDFSQRPNLHLISDTQESSGSHDDVGSSDSSNTATAESNASLKAMVIEAQDHSVIARPINEDLLLVLVAELPVSRNTPFNISLETESSGERASLDAAEAGKALALQRRKVEVLADFLRSEFGEGDFLKG